MKYCAIFHANLNYAYLLPEQYEFVIRNSYELIIDTMREKFPEQKYVFEASGYTLDQIAEKTPDVLAKLKAAVDSGQCEFMGSPYGHLMMPNFPEEDSVWALEFSQQSYEKHLGKRIVSGWNPECGWRSYVPHAFKKTGFKNITLDFDSYALSSMPEVKKIEYNPDKRACYGLDLPWYDMPASEKALRFPFKDIVPGLNGFTRTDRICQPALRWLMNMYTFDKYIDPVKKYSEENEGALIVFAEDAEYVGTTGWYYLKYFSQPERVFELLPDAREKLEKFVTTLVDIGHEFETFDYICNEIPPIDKEYYVEDGLAWHRAWAVAWRLTPEAMELDPICAGIRDRIYLAQEIASSDDEREKIRQAWFHLTCAENSDGRWPPPPEKVHPFNKGWVEDHIKKANAVLDEMLSGGGAPPAAIDAADAAAKRNR
jgi:hypothetical protein